MTTRIVPRVVAQRILVHALRSHCNCRPSLCPQSFNPVQLPLVSSVPNSNFSSRSFSGKKKKSPKESYEDDFESDDGDDSDWEDDQEIPFGEPMIPTNLDNEKGESTKKNPALESVIASGMSGLKATSTLISNHKETKKNLFLKGALDEDTGPTKQQLAEANRVQRVATECLELFQKKGKTHPLSIGGHPLLILHVDVNANLREATIHWALPFEILMEEDEETRRELSLQMQNRIDNGGGNYLQRQVHGILSSYYPPKLKFKPASDVVIQEMMFL